MPIIKKINSREAQIGVIGLGYVGLPLVIEFCRAGFHVTGFDVDTEKVAMLNQGKSYIKHIDPSSFAPFINPSSPPLEGLSPSPLVVEGQGEGEGEGEVAHNHSSPPPAGVQGVAARSGTAPYSSKLLEVNSKPKTQNSKLSEEASVSLEFNSKLKTQNSKLLEVNSKPKTQNSKLLEVNSKLKTQNSKLFKASCDFSLLREMDCIIVCVPTPLNKNREPDMQYVFNTTQTIADNLQKGQLIILESTTYPGTTDGDMRKILEKTGLKAGIDFHLAFSPEREDPNNRDFSVRTIPKVVGGYTEECLKAATALYNCIVERTVPVSSTKVAEATKLLENIYRSVNIALVNELKMLFDRMDINIWEVIEAAKTKPFGYQAFYPGPGLGGHCIPIDPFYLTWKAREFDFNTRFKSFEFCHFEERQRREIS